jgi:hypothetical protein
MLNVDLAALLRVRQYYFSHMKSYDTGYSRIISFHVSFHFPDFGNTERSSLPKGSLGATRGMGFECSSPRLHKRCKPSDEPLSC